MARSLINKLGKWYINWRGWHTDRKLLIIESDDWGTIRMPSRAAYDALAKQNPLVEQDAFARLDTLASATDLSRLFEVLTAFKDQHGNHPVITANTIVANPDFARIKASGFEKYFYEPFYETIARQPDGREVLDLWQQGMDKGVFRPQLHGREHVHVPAWLKLLRMGNKDLLAAFEWQCFGVPYRSEQANKRRNLLAAFDHHGINGEQAFHEQAISEAADLFADYFGFRSRSFIAPAYIWHPKLEPVLKLAGVELLQGLSLQYIPQDNRYRKSLRYTGQMTTAGVQHVIRNCFFEPALQPKKPWEDLAMQQIAAAFAARKPVVLGTHRINFIGGLEVKCRDANLARFRKLLQQIQRQWPEVEFISTNQLKLN